MSDNLLEKTLSAKHEILKQELIDLRRKAFRFNPVTEREYHSDAYKDYELCKKVYDHLCKIHWQTCKNHGLLHVIYRLTDQGAFFSRLNLWNNARQTNTTESTCDIINSFIVEAQNQWHEWFGIPFGHDEPFARIVADRVALSLCHFSDKICSASPETIFDNALSIGVLTYLLSYKQMKEIYDIDVLLKIDHLNLEGTLIYHSVKWIDEEGISDLRSGESLNGLTARFADHISAI